MALFWMLTQESKLYVLECDHGEERRRGPFRSPLHAQTFIQRRRSRLSEAREQAQTTTQNQATAAADATVAD